jgi:hypothetical protein
LRALTSENRAKEKGEVTEAPKNPEQLISSLCGEGEALIAFFTCTARRRKGAHDGGFVAADRHASSD